MAYKYPIPYVCSCPAAYMGSYCEISRTSPPEQSENDSTTIVLRQKPNNSGGNPSNETTKSFSSPYKLAPPNKSTTKLANTLNNDVAVRVKDIPAKPVSEMRSSSPTFNLSLATFYRYVTPEFPKPRKSYSNDFEVLKQEFRFIK